MNITKSIACDTYYTEYAIDVGTRQNTRRRNKSDNQGSQRQRMRLLSIGEGITHNLLCMQMVIAFGAFSHRPFTFPMFQ